MGTGGNDALAKSGFSKEEIAAALDYCDNDRAKTLQYLKKQQCGKGGVKWQDALRTALPTMQAPAKVKEYLEWMLEFDNVPLKPKPFKNFCKNSMALQRDEATVEGMWTAFEPLLKKKPAQQQQQQQQQQQLRSSPRLAAAATEQVKEEAMDEEEDEEEVTKKKKEKKAKKEKKEKKGKRTAEDDAEEAPAKKKKKRASEDDEDDNSDKDEEESLVWDKATKKEFKALKAKKKADEGLTETEKARFARLKEAKAAAAAE